MGDSVCVLCNDAIVDPLNFGEKLHFLDVTAHYYCLLLSSNLVQNGEENEGILGFQLKDIKAEVRRTKRLFCTYCKKSNATIGCCIAACRRSFHLPCALKQNCRLEFIDPYRSFCDIHHNIKRPKIVHLPTVECTICYEQMGKYNPIRSIPLPCCNINAWCHKLCLQKYAESSGYFLKCPLCNETDKFREWISKRGIFIPDKDARWEETGPNSFYDFDLQSERPNICQAKDCKSSKGRNYCKQIEYSSYYLIFCNDCGSKAAHRKCYNSQEFLCDDCKAISKNIETNKSKEINDQVLSKYRVRDIRIILCRVQIDAANRCTDSNQQNTSKDQFDRNAQKIPQYQLSYDSSSDEDIINKRKRKTNFVLESDSSDDCYYPIHKKKYSGIASKLTDFSSSEDGGTSLMDENDNSTKSIAQFNQSDVDDNEKPTSDDYVDSDSI